MMRESRIIKNTFFLYARTFIMMLLGVYSGRITLDMLGVSDYGTYQAVSGCIAVLNALNLAISAAISRFVMFELGRMDEERLNNIFITSINVLALLCVVIFVAAESVGLWFVRTCMQFPMERMGSVCLIFQLSLAGYLVGLITLPFLSILEAYEEFKYIATLTVVQGGIQFLLIVCVSNSTGDRLEWYAWVLFFTALLYQFSYSYVCIRKHSCIRYRPYIDMRQVKKLCSFASYSYIGTSAKILREQGVGILMNSFYGVVCSAARGVSVSVLGAVSSLVANFTTALSPQIIKAYASGEHEYMWALVSRGVRFSYFLLFIFSVPVLSSTEWLLSVWLKEVPPMAVAFTRLMIVAALCDTLSAPFIYLINATGKIALYQCVVGATLLLTLPLDLLLLYAGCEVEILLWVNIFVSVVLFAIRVLLIKRVLHFEVRRFLRMTLPRVMGTTFVVAFLLCLFEFSIPLEDLSFSGGVIREALIFITGCLGVYFVGMTGDERQYIHRKLKCYLLQSSK